MLPGRRYNVWAFIRHFHCLKSTQCDVSYYPRVWIGNVILIIMINNDPCEAETEFRLWPDDKWWTVGDSGDWREPGAWKVGNKRIVEVCTTIQSTPGHRANFCGDLWEEDIERVWPCRHCTSYHPPGINHPSSRWGHSVVFFSIFLGTLHRETFWVSFPVVSPGGWSFPSLC